jgi:hypothetical protein
MPDGTFAAHLARAASRKATCARAGTHHIMNVLVGSLLCGLPRNSNLKVLPKFLLRSRLCYH